MNGLFENIDFVYDYATLGFMIEVDCNYPEASKVGELVFNNHTFYVHKQKHIVERNGYISVAAANNLTVTNIKSTTQNLGSRSTMRLRGVAACVPNDEIPQFINYENNEVQMLPLEFSAIRYNDVYML